MASVTGFTADRMLEIENNTIVNAEIDASGHLILTRKDGTTVDAGRALDVLQFATDAEADAAEATDKILTPSNLGTDLSKLLPKRLQVVNNVGSGHDPDEFTETGFYSGYSWTGSLAGFSIGALEVIRYSPDWIVQIFRPIESGSRTYTRSYYSGTTWGVWQNQLNLANQYTDKLVKGQALGGGVNLDTITTPGTYWQNLSANAASGTNYPVGIAGILEVMSNGTSMHWQKYQPYGPNGTVIYYRQWYSGTGWTAWRSTNTEATSDTGWLSLTLQNSWVPYGSSYQGPQYRVKNGFFYMRGLISGGTKTAGTTLASFPSVYAPPATIIQSTVTNLTPQIGRLDIYATGEIKTAQDCGTWISLTVPSWPL